jgi:hypothetical protein
MENHVNQSPAIPKWSALLIEAVTKPGLIMKAYSAPFISIPSGIKFSRLCNVRCADYSPARLTLFRSGKT